MNRENPLITQVFEMKERDGLSNEEIAAELGITNFIFKPIERDELIDTLYSMSDD